MSIPIRNDDTTLVADIVTDLIAGIEYPSSKISIGATGVNDGFVSAANPFPVVYAALLTELQLKADLTETQPVSAASLPLPSGASSEATLVGVFTEIAAINVKFPGMGLTPVTGSLPVVLANDHPALPLPVGAATQTTLAALLTELQLKSDLTETQPISAASLPLPTGAATQTTLAALLTELQLKGDLSETQNVSIVSSVGLTITSNALPTGAATSANQTTEITALQLIDDIIVSQGTALGTTKNALIGGSVTTAAPTYTNGQISPLSLTTTGALRVDYAALLTELQLKADLTETQPVSIAGTVTVALASITNSVVPGTGATNLGKAEDAGHTTGDVGVFVLAVRNDALADFTSANIDYSPIAVDSAGRTFDRLSPVTGDGLTIHRTIGAGSTNATSVKASAGNLYGIFVSNINAAVVYLKFYNKASAPTVGTDTPVLTFMVPGNTTGAGLFLQLPHGISFATGIAFALTVGVADADTAAVTANQQVVNLLYK